MEDKLSIYSILTFVVKIATFIVKKYFLKFLVYNTSAKLLLFMTWLATPRLRANVVQKRILCLQAMLIDKECE